MQNIEVVEQKALSTIEQANAIKITTPAIYQLAADFLKTIKAAQREVKETFDPIVDKAYAAHKEAVAQRDKYYKPLVAAEGQVKTKLADWDCEQRRIAEAEQRRLQAEADEKARKEREKLEAQAAKAAEKGKTEKAEALQQQAAEVVAFAPQVEVNVPKVDGISYRTDWDIEITNSLEVPREWCVPDEKAIRAFAKATKGTKTLAGIRIFSKQVVSSR